MTSEATPMINGISWPVVLIVLTPEMPLASMVFSISTMKHIIMVTLVICIATQRTLSNVLYVVSTVP